MFRTIYKKTKELLRNIEWRYNLKHFESYSYWENRYLEGGNSGTGSYDHLAQFKAEIINEFVNKNNINSVIELGCGDGNQLSYMSYPQYIGFDVSDEALKLCREKFKFDISKQFFRLSQYSCEKADLVLSLDVIFHLVEDDIFENHMRLLFAASSKYVIIYSSNKNVQDKIQPIHVRHRMFTTWVDNNIIGWTLLCVIPNKYAIPTGKACSSFSDFYIYIKNQKTSN